jgi:prevent-host-death family protein
MPAVGVRELKARASQLLRDVRTRGTTIDVTHHGRVIARLVPASRDRVRSRGASAAPWSTLDRLATEIGARWPRGRSAAQAVREGRRRL